MIIYNGSNRDLEALIRPSEKKIRAGIRSVIGDAHFRAVDVASERLLVPGAFYEPEPAADTTYEISYVMSELSEVLKEAPAHVSELLQVKDALVTLNEVLANEFTVRVARQFGLNTDEWMSRLSPFDPRRPGYFRFLKDAEFLDYFVHWQKYVSEQAVASLLTKKFTKTVGAGDIVGFSETFKGDFGFGINVDRPTYDPETGFSAQGAINTTPMFSLSRGYSPESLMPISNRRTFILCSYIHEYGHFIEYILQKVPLQAVSSIAQTQGLISLLDLYDQKQASAQLNLE